MENISDGGGFSNQARNCEGNSRAIVSNRCPVARNARPKVRCSVGNDYLAVSSSVVDANRVAWCEARRPPRCACRSSCPTELGLRTQVVRHVEVDRSREEMKVGVVGCERSTSGHSAETPLLIALS